MTAAFDVLELAHEVKTLVVSKVDRPNNYRLVVSKAGRPNIDVVSEIERLLK